MSYFFKKRKLSKATDDIPVFSLNDYKGYAKVTSVYDGDTFKACITLDGKIRKFIFRTLGYDSPEMKPPLNTPSRDEHIKQARFSRRKFMNFMGFEEYYPYKLWNPFICNCGVNGWVWIECGKNDKYGRTLVTVYRNRWNTKSVNQRMIESGCVNVYDGGTKNKFDFKTTQALPCTEKMVSSI